MKPLRIRLRRFLPVFLGLTALGAAPEPEKRAFDPTDRYEIRGIEGWEVLINKSFLVDNPDLAGRALRRLNLHLEQVVNNVPPEAVKKLRQVRIWVEEREPHHPCMAYHPDPGWLREHDMNPDKAKCVEIANSRNFLSWTREQPWMVLHELAHAYHHQFLENGFGNPEVKAAYESSGKAGRYDSVLDFRGKSRKAYATTNPMEYFAECSEAFFGTNDFYPFVRAELRLHDPDMDSLLTRLWENRNQGGRN